MLILRVAKGIRQHLPARAAEWALAMMLFLWGSILAAPKVSMVSDAYGFMLRMGSEDSWAIACLVVGAVRLLALTINGTFADTAYSRWSPHVRAAMAVLSCVFWLQIAISFTATFGTGMAVYPVLLVLDIYCACRAAGDARHSDEDARHGRLAR